MEWRSQLPVAAEKIMLIGYARVSTQDQELALQHDELTQAGCKKIYSETMSGARGDRPQLELARQALRAGDVLVVWKLDRLGRSVKQLVNFIADLERDGIQFRSITDGIDTSTAAGRFFFHVMAALAQMERELMIERTRAGLAAARRRGRTAGRKRLLTDEKVLTARRLLGRGEHPKDVAEFLQVSVSTIYRHIPSAAALIPVRRPRATTPPSSSRRASAQKQTRGNERSAKV